MDPKPLFLAVFAKKSTCQFISILQYLAANFSNFDQSGINLDTFPTNMGPANDQSGHFPHQGINLGASPTKLSPTDQQALPPPNWDHHWINLGTFPTKLGPAGDQSGRFPYQTGTSKESIWALPPPNWDQQGINLGINLGASPTKMGPTGMNLSTSPTKLGLAGDPSGRFPAPSDTASFHTSRTGWGLLQDDT